MSDLCLLVDDHCTLIGGKKMEGENGNIREFKIDLGIPLDEAMISTGVCMRSGMVGKVGNATRSRLHEDSIKTRQVLT